LVVDSGESLLVDTLLDLKLTCEMLEAMRRAEPKATASIGTLVNTHSNSDHTFGNQLVADAVRSRRRNQAISSPPLPSRSRWALFSGYLIAPNCRRTAAASQ
jgi:glyoxylase-like metal-dependent hydrolase (beta-lactamase superfamily II)